MDKIQTLKIETFSSSGEGIAKIDGYIVFVDSALPNEVVEVEIYKQNKSFAKAKILKIITPSQYRVNPFCRLYNACGSCSLQYVDYDYQLKLKKIIVEDAMKNIAGVDISVNDVIASPTNKEFRCKIQYPVQQTKVSKRILAGYYKSKSHELVNIKYCPIQPEICDKIIEFIRQAAQELNLTCYDEKIKSGLLRHIVIRHSAYNGDDLVTLVVNDNQVFHSVKRLAHAIFDNFDSVKGVIVNFNETKSNLILGEKNELICGESVIEEKLLDKIFYISATTFFQVNPKSAENIFRYVKDNIQNNFNKPSVLDAYAGIASFGIVVSDVAKNVLSVEENKSSTDLAQEVIKLNNITNVEVMNADTGEFLKSTKEKFDVVILDPPRKGCDMTTLDETYRLAQKQIIYVSCNPATLARDLKYLIQKGCTVESIQPFDMFCHTLHVETVAIINVN